MVYEKLYGTPLHLRGATVVERAISSIPRNRLAVLRAEELGTSEFTLTGWLKHLEQK